MEENLKIVSIITVVFNGVNEIEETIKSVLIQSYKNIEYIIIDGGSTDGTVCIIEKYQKKIHRWKSEKDKGIYYAMNKGLSLATGEYVYFLNAGDTIYNKDVIANMLERMPNVDIFYGKISLVRSDRTIKKVVVPSKKLSWKSFVTGMPVSHQSVIIRKKIVPLYNVRYQLIADQDWLIQSFKMAQSIKYYDLVVSNYLIGGFSEKNAFLCWKEKRVIVRSHFGLIGVLYNDVLYALFCFKYMVKRLGKKKLLRAYA